MNDGICTGLGELAKTKGRLHALCTADRWQEALLAMEKTANEEQRAACAQLLTAVKFFKSIEEGSDAVGRVILGRPTEKQS